jgi:hypothetical protein
MPVLPISNDLPLIPSFKAFLEANPNPDRPLVQEPLVTWAAEEWKRRFSDLPCLVMWASGECLNRVSLSRIKAGRKLGNLGTFQGFEPIPCPLAIPTNWRRNVRGMGIVPAASAGAILFTFESQGQTFPLIVVSVTYHDTYGNIRICPIALCPPPILNLYQLFETLCIRLAREIEPSPRIQVIGGQEDTFEATIDWDDLILGESLKAEVKHEMDAFFDKGIGLYQELKLAPFRKLLFVGPPGTGKSTLCAALAKHALKRKMVVVYVSAADDEGASFGKVYQALRIVAEAKHPTLLIIEELDVYLREQDKSQILNVLDGMEAPNNPRGALMVATTNYPEVIDERIAKRPGRIDRIFMIPPIEDTLQAAKMLQRYMNTSYREEHRAVFSDLIGKTGAFVREIALHSRMAALMAGTPTVSVEMLRHAIHRLDTQLNAGPNLQTPLIVELPEEV